jgi:hypothetical protein
MERTLAGKFRPSGGERRNKNPLLFLQPYLNFTDVVYGIGDVKEMLEECRE